MAVLLFMAAVLVTLEESAKGGMQKFFKYVPAVVLCYLIAMFLCTLGVWDMAETKPAYSALKNNLTYAMIFAMLLRCDIRKLLKLGLFTAGVASLANIGGTASAPIIAVAYNPNYAGIGVLMGIFGQAIGNFFGLGMGWLLNLMA